jgi:hypothetical protein
MRKNAQDYMIKLVPDLKQTMTAHIVGLGEYSCAECAFQKF